MDAFALLRGGVRFNNKKFADARDLFEKEEAPESDTEGDYIKELFKLKKAKKTKAGRHPRTGKRRSNNKDDDEEEGSSENENYSEDDDDDDDDDDGTEILQEKAFRKQHKIYVKGDDIPAPIRIFDDLLGLGVSERLVASLNAKYASPMPIQMQGLPVMLNKRDIVGVAPTGSGKTFCFGIPLLTALKKPKAKGFRAVVLAPTRELAHQTKVEFDFLNKHLALNICELTKANAANYANPRGKFDILISTPMRLVHALTAHNLSLRNVQWLVVDEADSLFENGYEKQLDDIITACENRKHVALFSATMPQRVEDLARSVLNNYIRVGIGAPNAANTSVKQRLVFTGDESGKSHAITQLIQDGLKPPVLIFVQSKSRAKDLFHELVYENINVDVIHAERTKQQRDDVVKAFREGRVWVLICTDLLGRGIDFKGVNLVINYDFPPSANEYIHRIGRTGRGGRDGEAVTFFTIRDAPMLKSVANVMKASGCDVEDWMLEMKGLKKHQRSRTITREAISTDAKAQVKDKEKRVAWAQKNEENKKKRAKLGQKKQKQKQKKQRQ